MRTGVVSLILSVAALGAVGFVLTRETPPPQRAPEQTNRMRALERRLAEVERRMETVSARATLPPLAPEPRETGAVDAAPREAGENDPELAAIVDEAVNRKTKQVVDELRIKANKKPKMEVFADMLELNKNQRLAAERTVADGQRKVQEILNVPMADGTNLLAALVEIAAKGIAQPGKDHGWGKLFGAIMTQKVPGTDETYGKQIEAVNQSIRDRFKRDWTKEQYREFQEWGVNPTDIESVPNSPHEELMRRILDRARKLGADVPEEGD